MIRESGHVPVERDTLYRIVATYAEETEAPAWDAGPIAERLLSYARPQTGVAAETRQASPAGA